MHLHFMILPCTLPTEPPAAWIKGMNEAPGIEKGERRRRKIWGNGKRNEERDISLVLD